METRQFFCSHCGETKTYKSDDPRVQIMEKGDQLCRTCLQGKMLPAT
jgi:hypothetical protein